MANTVLFLSDTVWRRITNGVWSLTLGKHGRSYKRINLLKWEDQDLEEISTQY